MVNRFLKLVVFLVLLVLISLFYLSYVGIETNKFNKIIAKKITDSDSNLKIEINKVKIFLNIKNLSLNITTFEPILYVGNNPIKLDKLNTNLSIYSYFNRNFAIQNIQLSSSKISVSNLIKSIRLYQKNVQLLILDQIIEKGFIKINFSAKFDKNGKIKDNFLLDGVLQNANLKLLNNDRVNGINFSFNATKNKYLFENVNLEIKKLNINFPKLKIIKQEDAFFVEGEFRNSKQEISLDILAYLFKNLDFEKINTKKILLASKNIISFKLDKKLKLSNLNINSKIDLEKLIFISKNKLLLNSDNSIEFKENILNISYKENKWQIDGNGTYSINKKFDNTSYSISISDNLVKFDSTIELKNWPFEIKLLNYKKKDNQEAILNFEGEYKKNKFLKFKNINFTDNNNYLKITKLFLDNNFKVVDLNKLDLNFINQNNKQNNLSLIKSKNNYTLKSDIFDGSIFLDKLLKDNDDFKFSKIFKSLNNNIFLEFKKFFLDKNEYVNNLVAKIQFEQNNITALLLNSNFKDNKQLNLSMNINDKGEKITTVYSGNAKPLVKKYDFVKGFSEGSLDFYSIKKNKNSKSKLTINNFKLNKLPVLTKILTLASLQGAADLLTGEGIRFNNLEMDFKTEGKLVTIEEMYAIGPAISILMSGYIEEGKLVSLRGTLVPATTLNKVIGSLPLIGNILVGKKVGEGIFGVSFKIKGPPKKLKTTVNPIKTLTPRFITRTIEKVKRKN